MVNTALSLCVIDAGGSWNIHYNVMGSIEQTHDRAPCYAPSIFFKDSIILGTAVGLFTSHEFNVQV